MSEALIKASYFQGTINALAVLGSKRAEAERLLQAEIAATKAASRADWLPMTFDFKLTAVVHDLGGKDAVVALNRASFLAATDGPLLRPIVQGALRVFGVSPRAFVKMVGNAWEAGTRNAGAMSASFEDDHSAIVVLNGLHAELRWYEGFIGLLEGVYEITAHEGTATVTAHDGGATYEMRWRPRKGS